MPAFHTDSIRCVMLRHGEFRDGGPAATTTRPTDVKHAGQARKTRPPNDVRSQCPRRAPQLEHQHQPLLPLT